MTRLNNYFINNGTLYYNSTSRVKTEISLVIYSKMWKGVIYHCLDLSPVFAGKPFHNKFNTKRLRKMYEKVNQ